jgi:polyisoprenoid-binding protein YceI
VATATETKKRRPLRWIVAAAAVVVVVGAFGVYWEFFRNDAPKKFAVSTTPAQPVDAATLAGTWKPATGSQVGYRVREKLSELPAKSDAVGRTSAVNGSVVIDRQGDTFTASNVQFQADLRQLTSDRGIRDQRMHEYGLESDDFPTASFTSTKPVTIPSEAVQGQKVTVQSEGDLTIHGVTKHVTIPIDAKATGSQIELAGSLNFPLTDYRISIPSFGGFVTVDGDANLEFHLLLAK